jgi:hypothetical protein
VGEIYEYLVKGREEDSKRFWTIFSLMSVINSGLLAGYPLANQIPVLEFWIPILGVILCITWYLTIRRMHAWVAWWEKKLVEFEPKFFEEINAQRKKKRISEIPDTFAIFQNRWLDRSVGISTRVAGWLIPLLFSISWLILFFSKLRLDFSALINGC